MTDDRKVVEFETVHRRFTEAVETITQLYTLLEGLRRAEAQKEQTVTTMSNASERLSETSETIASYCVLLRSALDATLKALESAEELASGTDLKTIRSELVTNSAALTHLVEHEDSLDSALVNLDARQRSISRTVEVIHNRIEGDLTQARESRDSAQSELANLDARQRSISRTVDVIHNRIEGDLTQARESRDSAQSALANLDARQRSIRRTVDVIHNRIEGDLTQARESRDSAQSELATVKERLDKLETSIASLPPKIRRKYTLGGF